jgi:hypothetical protein
MEQPQKQKVIEVYSVSTGYKKAPQQPGIAVTASHDCSPEWVADVMYAIFCKYLDSIDDGDQIGYTERIREAITHRFRAGYDHIESETIIFANNAADEEDD